MKNLLIVLILILVGCKETSVADTLEDTTVEEEVTTIITDSVSNVESAPVISTKYSFMVIITEEPIGVEDLPWDNAKYIQRENKRYTTEVIPIDEEVTEDYKYRELDLAESNLREVELDEIVNQYRSVANTYGLSRLNAEVKIVSREMYIFDTYKEASIKRQEIMSDLELTASK
jgi:hypothetical protein